MKSVFRSIRTHVLLGGVLVTPVVVTLWIILFLVNFLTTSRMSQWLVSPVIRHLPGRDTTAVQALVSLTVVLSLLFLIGIIFRNFLGRKAIKLLDRILERIPLINKIYLFVRNVSESIVSQKETMFREVVMIEYPRPGMHAIAFVSAKVPPRLQQASGTAEPMVYVFLPTTPNPTSGFLLLVPNSQVRTLDMNTADAMRLIVSAGAAGPGQHEDGSRVPTLLDKLEQMLESRRLAALRPKPEPAANLNFDDRDER